MKSVVFSFQQNAHGQHKNTLQNRHEKKERIHKQQSLVIIQDERRRITLLGNQKDFNYRVHSP